ncbi:sensor histidine kinase [Embleya scabrispora]|uniref:sensor histidine kinase n=1 Tax=Embleya scabrispora TaxID=159449 RepID=UPI00037FB793|nr:sensor histidine kinase [Embleya scabrispora]MYS79701.1 sensor histidine kinase [Streptomyces sp. SID5474]
MSERPQLTDRFRAWTLHRWYVLFWVLLGLAPMVVAGKDDPGASRYWSMGLPVVLGLCYLITRVFPGNPVLRPGAFPGVLIVGLGAMAYTRDGGATACVASLPHFWFAAGVPGSAIGYSGLAAAATVLGGVAPQGWSPNLLTGNTLATVIAYAVSVPLGLSIHRFVEHSGERVRALGSELASAQERLAEANQRRGAVEERERLAREIHDTLAQGFASIIVLAEAARSGIASDPETSGRQLLSIEHTARENLAEARVLVGSAPQSGVVPGSVARALRRTLDRFVEDTGITVDAELPDVECDQQTRIALLRCTQESLANVRKHAGAGTVGVVLARHAHGVELEITDDGRGFVVDRARGFGLDGMRRRLAELGGEFTVTSSVGDGTRILAMIPSDGQG